MMAEDLDDPSSTACFFRSESVEVFIAFQTDSNHQHLPKEGVGALIAKVP